MTIKLQIKKFKVLSLYNIEENKMYLENIGLHLGCIAEKVIYNSWNDLFF